MSTDRGAPRHLYREGKLYLIDASGREWRVVRAYRCPPNWKLTTTIRPGSKVGGRLFIAKDRTVRFYDPRDHTDTRKDWSPSTLAAQLEQSVTVDVEAEREYQERVEKDVAEYLATLEQRTPDHLRPVARTNP